MLCHEVIRPSLLHPLLFSFPFSFSFSFFSLLIIKFKKKISLFFFNRPTHSWSKRVSFCFVCRVNLEYNFNLYVLECVIVTFNIEIITVPFLKWDEFYSYFSYFIIVQWSRLSFCDVFLGCESDGPRQATSYSAGPMKLTALHNSP